MGCDQYTVPDTVAVEPTFVAWMCSGPLRKPKVMVCDLCLVDFNPFCVILGSLLLNFRVRSRVFEQRCTFYLSSEFFLIFVILNPASLDCSDTAFKSRRNTDMGGWKRNGTFPPTFPSLLPPLFDKHSGCYGNDLIDVAEKPKILKRFWQRRSRVIRNSCKKVALKGLIITRPHYLFKGKAFQLVQILNLSLWPHLLWRKVSSKLLYRG